MRIYFLVLFILFSCNEDGVPSEDDLQELKKDVQSKGDYYSWLLLDVYYDEHNKTEELIPYTLSMITIHKNKKLYSNLFHEYLFLIDKSGRTNSFSKFNIIHKSYLINILLEGSKNNDLACMAYLDTIYRFGYFKNKNITKADSLRLIIDKELRLNE